VDEPAFNDSDDDLFPVCGPDRAVGPGGRRVRAGFRVTGRPVPIVRGRRVRLPR